MNDRSHGSANGAPERKNDRIVIGAGIVVVVALIAFVVVRTNRTASVHTPPPPPAATATVATPPVSDHDHAAEESIRRITPAELRTATERGEAVVIDVRAVADYSAGHLPGAMHIPLEYIESQVQYLPRNKMLVTYCT